MVGTHQLDESWTGFTPNKRKTKQNKQKKKNFSSRSIGRKKEKYFIKINVYTFNWRIVILQYCDGFAVH